ncbi:MAG: biopolymer transporter ExbD [Bdellovibrionales bacterium]|nr:biopolymer transporter ExbD [Bdellovibrionales bacterium]NQZ19956.1 biopolymer transporter ExbD [Bdellovibrionales bacterium]
MKYIRKQSSNNEGVDVSPLIDMVFILLIFFMVSTTFIKDMQVDLNRPGAASAKPASSKSIRVFIDRNEKIYVDGQSVRPWILQGKLRDMAKGSKSSSVLVVTDRKVSADKLVDVVDQCRLAGIKDIGVATEAEVGS